MTAASHFRAHGVLTVWAGNDAALTLASPAIEVSGRVAVTRGESWTSPHDISTADVTASDGYVSVDPVDITEGDVAWLAGPEYVASYLSLLDSGIGDRLEMRAPGISWQVLDGDWQVRFGSAMRFYELGALVASDARQFYEKRLADGDTQDSDEVLAARTVYTGSAGVGRGERRLADAVWYSLVGDFDVYARSLHLASAATGRTEAEVKELVERQVEFYRVRSKQLPSAAVIELREGIIDLQEQMIGLVDRLLDVRRENRAELDQLMSVLEAMVVKKAGEPRSVVNVVEVSGTTPFNGKASPIRRRDKHTQISSTKAYPPRKRAQAKLELPHTTRRRGPK